MCGDAARRLKMERPLKAVQRSKATDNVIECPICKEVTEQPYLSYGIKACFSCRAFFRRAHQKTKMPTFFCRQNNACPINVKTRRTCQKCRYSACLKAGMQPELVMDEAQKKSRFKNSLYYQKWKSQDLLSFDKRRRAYSESARSLPRHLIEGETFQDPGRQQNEWEPWDRNEFSDNVGASKDASKSSDTLSSDNIDETRASEVLQQYLDTSNQASYPGEAFPGNFGIVQDLISPEYSFGNGQSPTNNLFGLGMSVYESTGQDFHPSMSNDSLGSSIESTLFPHNYSYHTTVHDTSTLTSTPNIEETTPLDFLVNCPTSYPFTHCDTSSSSCSSLGSDMGLSSTCAAYLDCTTSGSYQSNSFNYNDPDASTFTGTSQTGLKSYGFPSNNNDPRKFLANSFHFPNSQGLPISSSSTEYCVSPVLDNYQALPISSSSPEYCAIPVLDNFQGLPISSSSKEYFVSPALEILDNPYTDAEEDWLQQHFHHLSQEYCQVALGEEFVKEFIMYSSYDVPLSKNFIPEVLGRLAERYRRLLKVHEAFNQLGTLEQSQLLQNTLYRAVALTISKICTASSGLIQMEHMLGRSDKDLVRSQFQPRVDLANLKKLRMKCINSYTNYMDGPLMDRYSRLVDYMAEVVSDDTIYRLVSMITLFSSEDNPVCVKARHKYVTILKRRLAHQKLQKGDSESNGLAWDEKMDKLKYCLNHLQELGDILHGIRWRKHC